jgi:dTDP-4-amino-4,6-dideoxygalactose transaminase
MGQSFGYGAGMLPVTEELSVRVLRLPFYYDMTEEEQSFVVERVTEFLDRPRP